MTIIEARISALNAIVMERERQDELKAAGKFANTCADSISNGACLAILVEEVGEIARAMNEWDKNPGQLKKEVTQVAAVAMAWLEGFYLAESTPPLPAMEHDHV